MRTESEYAVSDVIEMRQIDIVEYDGILDLNAGTYRTVGSQKHPVAHEGAVADKATGTDDDRSDKDCSRDNPGALVDPYVLCPLLILGFIQTFAESPDQITDAG